MLKILYREADKLNYKPRKNQIDAINWLEKTWDSNNICKVLSSPVSSGKSLIAKTIAEFEREQEHVTAIVTPQNLLVDQYASEFPDLNYFKGKAQYHCAETETTCEEGLELEKITKKPCPDCPYKKAKQRCYDEFVSVFNPFSYYVLPKVRCSTEGNLECLYSANTMIIDEVQSLPSMLREFSSIKIWWHDIQWEIGISASIPKVVELLGQYTHKLMTYIVNPLIDKKEKVKILQSQKRVDTVSQQVTLSASYFICEETTEKFRGVPTKCLSIRPKYIPPEIIRKFFKMTNRVILMSGTVFKYTWEELGFKSVDYLDLPSSIDVNRRRVFATNSINISHKSTNNALQRWDLIQNLAAQIKYIVDYIHPDENGIVLLSYGLAEEIKCLLDEEHYVHMTKKNKKEKITNFKSNNTRQIGVFSGSYEGLSLNDDISRFTIIPKVPYGNLMDKVVKVRADEKPINYQLEAITNIIQGSGRSTRTEKDYSTIYILDKNFIKLYASTKRHIPKYFVESVRFEKPGVEHINILNKLRESA